MIGQLTDLYLILAFIVVAALYGSVGHGGASGYLAVMALAGMAPITMRPMALIMNIAVSFIGTVMFVRAGHFSWRLLWPFGVASVPFAWLGGVTNLSPVLFKILVGCALLVAALRLFIRERTQDGDFEPPPLIISGVVGAAIGFLSGLIGVGGGIFLTPLVILMRWANAKTAAAISAPFILVNSVAGLAGNSSSLANLPAALPFFIAAVMAGGWLGACWGSRRATSVMLRLALGLVLLFASFKMVLTL